MSVTKLENIELTSQVDVNSAKSRCSCLECDSVGCFLKRHKTGQQRCQCFICKDLRNCAILSCKSNQDKHPAVKDNARKKIIKEVVTRETIESLKRVTETMYEFSNTEKFEMIMDRQSKLSSTIATPMLVDTKICTENKQDGTERADENAYSKPIAEVPSTSNDGFKKEKSDKEEFNKQETITPIPSIHRKQCCKHKTISHTSTPSANLSDHQKGDNTATKLSAQVMNVPYEEIPKSFSYINEIEENSPISKLNIFKRIKEIYEACSCKVCECISSKPLSLQDDFCKCKPCDCRDCAKLRKNIDEKIRLIPQSGCPCIRCDRKDCRGICKRANEKPLCDCGPSDSVLNSRKELKPCNCTPCECINCKSLLSHPIKTVKLGKVDKIIQNDPCHCSPCECVECKQIYSRTNPTLMHTTSTQMNVYRNCRCDVCQRASCAMGETVPCKCETSARTIKPFGKNFHDYDIRTVFVDSNSPFNHEKQSVFKNNDTIAVFTSLNNDYMIDSCNGDICNCSDCECIVCPGRDHLLRNETKSNFNSIRNAITMPASIVNVCRCNPCECEICSKVNDTKNIRDFQSKCKCDVCDCLNCDQELELPTCSIEHSNRRIPECNSNVMQQSNRRIPEKPIKYIEMNDNCNCRPCVCSNCNKLFSCSSSVKFYSNKKQAGSKTARRLKKVMLITPTTSLSHFDAQTINKKEESSTISHKISKERLFHQEFSTCHASPHNNYNPISDKLTMSQDQNSQFYKLVSNNNCFLNNEVETDLILEAANSTIDENTLLNSYDLTQNYQLSHDNFITDQPSENKIRLDNLNAINERPIKLTTDDSNKSLPFYWTCRNDSLYPNIFPRGIKITCKVSESKSKTELVEQLPHVSNQSNEQSRKNIEEFPSYHDIKDKNKLLEFALKSRVRPYSLKNTVTNQCDIDYQRTVRVLYEAKAFSSKLVKLLDSFERANRDFESASHKFKNLHNSLLEINNGDLNKYCNMRLERKQSTIHEATISNRSEINYDLDENKNENEAEKEYEQCTATSSKVIKVLRPSHGYFKETDNLNVPNNDNGVFKNDIRNEFNLIKQCEEITHCKYTEDSRSNVINSFNFASISDTLNNDRLSTEIERNITSNQLSQSLDPISNTPHPQPLHTAMTTDSCINTENFADKENYKKGHTMPLEIFKKNLYVNAPQEHRRSRFHCPKLEIDIKEAVHALSQTTKNDTIQNKITPRTNEALVNLRSEVKDLLNMPQLQPNSQYRLKPEVAVPDLRPKGEHSKLDLDIKSMSSFASSQTCQRIFTKSEKQVNVNINSEENKRVCEDLKTNFVGLRRVSDHTVLVKWRIPKRIQGVQGYELLVDGRAVQKILSPTRSMAVVTCLPHADRVLLTVRALAAAGRAPAATVVYRPRSK